MKTILLICLCIGFAYADKSEKLFWDEVKNSSDVELLKLYKKQYPHGIFERLADIKIKRLIRSNKDDIENDTNTIPLWIKGDVEYKFFGIGKANKHFRGKEYQKNLAQKRATSSLEDSFDTHHLSNDLMDEYNTLIEMKTYEDKNGRIYILRYIDNTNI